MFLPALNSASVKYNFKQSLNSENMLPPGTSYSTAVSFGNVQGGSDETLTFAGVVRCTLNVGVATLNDLHAWVFDMRIQVGSKYYTNTNGYPEWSNTSSDRYRILSPWWHLWGFTGTYTYYFVIGLETLPVPASGAGTFEFDFIEIQDTTGATITLPGGSTTSHICEDFAIHQHIGESYEAGEEEHTSTNEDGASNPVDSSSVLQFPDMLTGDGPHFYSDGRVQIYTHGGAWENSNDEWTVSGAVSGGININALLCEEAIAAQKAPTRVYSGTMIGNGVVLHAITVLIIDSKKYQLRSGQYNANTNTWGGDWVQIHVDRANITTLKDTTFKKGDPKTLGMGNMGGWLQEQINRTTKTNHINGYRTLLVGNHTVSDTDSIIYANPGIGGLTITLPVFTETENRAIIMVNVSAANSLTVGRDAGGDKINAAASDFTLAADTSIQIHNTGMTGIGWATIFKSARK